MIYVAMKSLRRQKFLWRLPADPSQMRTAGIVVLSVVLAANVGCNAAEFSG
jgi:hypothetical protein